MADGGASAAAPPVASVDLPDIPLPAGHGKQTVTVTYRNDSSTDQTVAPQILIESPDQGPFLDPANVRLEALASDGHWHDMPLYSQTGTLYTRLIPAKTVLPGHHTLTQHYRLTVLKPSPGTIEPVVAIYG
ncbi:signal peptide protein [Streptomyces sp. FH025]|nr:signal peptide protein [Streptomyces sp. FH025]